MFVTPYRIFWIISTSDLVISYTDKLLVFRKLQIVCLLLPFFFFFAMKDFMITLSDDNQADIIEAFNSTSRYLDDVLNIDNPYFEETVNQIYPTELQLNQANASDTEAPSWINIYLFLKVLFPPKFMINPLTLILIL